MNKLAMIQSKVLAKKRVIKQNLKDWEKQLPWSWLQDAKRNGGVNVATMLLKRLEYSSEHCQTRITGDWIMIIRQNLFWIQFAIIDSGNFTKLLIQILSSNIKYNIYYIHLHTILNNITYIYCRLLMIYCLGSFGIRLYHIDLWRETEIISRYVCKEKYRQHWTIVKQVCSMWKMRDED